MSHNPDDLTLFHNGDRRAMADCYERHFEDVWQAVGTVLQGADRDTVVHEVFLALLESGELRRSFMGGSLGAWLRVVARNRAIDHHRRVVARERPLLEETQSTMPNDEGQAQDRLSSQLDARHFLEKINAAIPAKWAKVFEARFVRQLSQRDAAATLNMHRTTLAYQELQLRRLLRRMLKESRTS
ncbi:MAG: RNA polymerase sigma factor [Deltaproteobacteria bacterium]|nr:RNA polymerase sigma factor [Deltaproteobacteria bacterium]